MRRRLQQILVDRRVHRAADVALALGLAAAALVDLAGDPVAWGGRGIEEVLLALAVTLPLAVRVRFPIGVAAVLNIGSGLLLLLAAPTSPRSSRGLRRLSPSTRSARTRRPDARSSPWG